MHSYSFDLGIMNSNRNNFNSKKFNIKMNDVKWINLIFVFITLNQLLFNLHFHIFSLLINISILLMCLYIIFFVLKIQKETESDQIENILINQLIDKSKFLIYFLTVSIVDVVLVFFTYTNEFIFDNTYTDYFTYFKLFFLCIKVLMILLLRFYFKKLYDYKEQDNNENVDDNFKTNNTNSSWL